MKSLKRTLCLVLALVMVLGLFGIASATNFTDDNDIQYKEAVEVVTGIGAIKGYDNGTFNPKGTITRAEAAVMVARVALTNAIADDLKGVTSNFTDVTVEGGFSWAIPSIEYLVSKNIINGMGDGTFNPNGQISGYAVLKMLLCVLGYGAKQEYTGTGWDLQVAVDSNNKGLTAGRAEGTPALSASATREEVALYCFNALGTEVVSYNSLENRYESTATSAGTEYDPDNTGKITLGEDVYKIKKKTGVITDNQAVSATQKYTKLDNSATEIYNIKTGADMIGHYVTIYYKDKATTVGGVEKPGTTYSVVDISNVVKFDKAIDVASADTAAKAAEQAKTFKAAFGKDTTTQNLFADNVVLVGTNGVAGAPIAKGTLASGQTNAGEALGDTYFKAGDNAQKANAGTYILNEAGLIVSYIANPVYSVAVISNYKAATAQDTGSITYKKGADGTTAEIVIPKTGDTDVTRDPAMTYATWSLYDGLAKGDVVTIIETGNFKTMAKATTATGKVTAVNTSTDTPPVVTMVADGTTYTKSGAFAAKANISSVITKAVDFTALDALNQNCVLYLGPDGRVVAAATVDEVVDTNLAYVVDTYSVDDTPAYGGAVSTQTVYVQAVDIATGKEVKYVVGVGAAKSGGAVTAGNGITATDAANFRKTFVKVSTKLNETYNVDVATLTAVASAEAVTGAVTGGSLAVTDKAISGTKCYIGADTQFIVVAKATDGTSAPTCSGSGITPLKVTTLTGPQTVSSKDYGYYAVAADTTGNSNVKYVVVLGAVAPTATNNKLFVPTPTLSAAKVVNYTKADGKEGKAFENVVFIDGTPKTILIDAGDGTVTSNATNVTFGFKDSYVVTGEAYSNFTPSTAGDTSHVGYGIATNAYNGSIRTIVWNGGTALTDMAVDSEAFIVDVPYLNDQLTNGGKGNLTNHNSVDKLVGGKIAYTYTGAIGTATMKITGIYYLGEPDAIAFGDVDSNTATNNSAVYAIENPPATVVPGKTYTVTVSITDVSTVSDGTKTETVTLSDDNVTLGTCQFNNTEAKEATSTKTITFTVPSVTSFANLKLAVTVA